MILSADVASNLAKHDLAQAKFLDLKICA